MYLNKPTKSISQPVKSFQIQTTANGGEKKIKNKGALSHKIKMGFQQS